VTVVALRDVFGAALVERGLRDSNFVVVDADNAPATRASNFIQRFPGRAVNVGCAEQNLVGVSAGIAATGIPTVATTFAIFLCGRAFEQIRNLVAQAMLPVTLVGTHAGVTVGHDGPSHFSVEDIALMRSVPGMQVLVASSSAQVAGLVDLAIESKRPTYIRISRHGTACRFSGPVSFAGINRLRDGTDVTLITCGVLVDLCLEAAEALATYGMSAEVLDIYSLKPLAEDAIAAALTRTGAAVIVEEHGVAGGLGEAVSHVLAQRHPTRLEHVCVRETLGRSGTPEAVLDLVGLTVPAVLAAVERVLK